VASSASARSAGPSARSSVSRDELPQAGGRPSSRARLLHQGLDQTEQFGRSAARTVGQRMFTPLTHSQGYVLDQDEALDFSSESSALSCTPMPTSASCAGDGQRAGRPRAPDPAR
jgi:hypothetical protein